MLQRDDPTFSDWDQDAAAEAGNYNEADPTKAADEVRAAIDATIEMLSELGPDVIDRRGLRSISMVRSEEHTSELQSRGHLVCRLLLEKKKNTIGDILTYYDK